MDNITHITEGSIDKSIFRLSLPAMVSMISIMLFEFIDLFWIGKLGSEAVAAMGAASFVVWTLKSLANCVAAGLNALVSRNAGSRNYQRMSIWASQGVMLTMLFTILLAALTFSINLFLFDLLGLEPNVAKDAQNYTLIITLGLVFIYQTISLENIFRAAGNTLIPMIVIVFTLFLNAILDPFFIFGWYGFPQMGMPGGALASVISHSIGFIILSSLLKHIRIKFKFILKDFVAHSLEILRIGTPIGLLGGIFSIIYIILSKNIAYFGTAPMAAISICHRIEGIPFFIAFGFSTAVAAIVGQNIGAGNPDRAEKATHRSLIYASVFLLFSSILFILFGEELMSFFINDAEVIKIGSDYLFAIAIFEVFLGPEIMLEGAFTGAGDTKPPFLISIPLTLLRVPASYLFSITLDYGVNAIWWVIGTTTMLKGIMFFVWFERGKWKHKKIG
ncbi:MATE family efflux transporter [candidate division KSB1 bacterium]|nr:MATE family efflux transporter [candidate division KSB1 bacterium]